MYTYRFFFIKFYPYTNNKCTVYSVGLLLTKAKKTVRPDLKYCLLPLQRPMPIRVGPVGRKILYFVKLFISVYVDVHVNSLFFFNLGINILHPCSIGELPHKRYTYFTCYYFLLLACEMAVIVYSIYMCFYFLLLEQIK